MMTVKFFFSAKLKLISDNWEFISANALSLLWVTGAEARREIINPQMKVSQRKEYVCTCHTWNIYFHF